MKRIAWRDSMMTWPGLSVKIELAPWHWRLFRWYSDEVHWYSYCTVEVGPFEVQLMLNEPPFELAYRDSAEPALPPDISWMSPTGNEKDWMTV